MNILKNPTVLGLIIGTLVYGYLYYTTNERNEENEKKKKHRRKEKETVNIAIPLVVAVITWFIAYAYFEYNDGTNTSSNPINEFKNFENSRLSMQLNPSPKFQFVGDVISESSDPKEFALLNSGINVPSNLPDILLDVR